MAAGNFSDAIVTYTKLIEIDNKGALARSTLACAGRAAPLLLSFLSKAMHAEHQGPNDDRIFVPTPEPPGGD